MNYLDAFLVSPDKPFLWRTLTGPSGIGKSRLAIEWLQQCKAKKWDYGIFDPEDKSLLHKWRPRRPTAIVIDELQGNSRLSKVLEELSKAATKKTPIRVLVVDQQEPQLQSSEHAIQHQLDECKYFQEESTCLDRLPDESIKKLLEATDCSESEITENLNQIQGRPRRALIFLQADHPRDFIDAIQQWADRFLPPRNEHGVPTDPDIYKALALAALVGPVSSSICQDISQWNPELLRKYFDKEEQYKLDTTLPQLQPEEVAQEVIFRNLKYFNESVTSDLLTVV